MRETADGSRDQAPSARRRQAAAQEWLGQTLALAGKTSEEREAAAAALAVYEAKRDVAAIAWTRALLDSLGGSAVR
jgi:hypothetical protein